MFSLDTKVFIFLVFCSQLFVNAANVTVGPDDPLGISGAISSASGGGGEAVVYVLAGNYTGKNNCDLLIQNNNFNFTLIGIQGSDSTTIDCGHQSRCLKIVGGGSVKIVGIHFRNGQAPNLPQNNNNLLRNSNSSRKLLVNSDGSHGVDDREDPAIKASSSLKTNHKKAATIKNNNKAIKTISVEDNSILSHDALRDSSSSDGITGGCVFISQGANVEMIDVHVSGGRALNGSGIGALDSTVSMDGCLITSNGVSYSINGIELRGGGAFMSNCSVAMKNSIIENNFLGSVGQDAGVYGCGVYMTYCNSVVLTGSVAIQSNTAKSSTLGLGAGIGIEFSNNILFNGSITIFNNSAEGSSALEGAGVQLFNVSRIVFIGEIDISYNSIQVTSSISSYAYGAGVNINGCSNVVLKGPISISFNTITSDISQPILASSTNTGGRLQGAGFRGYRVKSVVMYGPIIIQGNKIVANPGSGTTMGAGAYFSGDSMTTHGPINVIDNSIYNMGTGNALGGGLCFTTVQTTVLDGVNVSGNSVILDSMVMPDLINNTVAVHDVPAECLDITLYHDVNGIIRTNASMQYLTSSDCVWELSGNAIQSLQNIYSINVTRIDVEYQASCSYDWLAFYDGDSIYSPIIGKYCGSYPNPNPHKYSPLTCVEGPCPDIHDIVSSGSFVTVKFNSDNNVIQGTGFEIEWHMVSRNTSYLVNGNPVEFTDTLLGSLPYALGGGIESYGCEIKIINSIISNNIVKATYMAIGAGIGDATNSNYQIINSTIDGNVATAVIGGGGGIALQSGSKFDIYNSTISNNAAIGYGECFWFDGDQCPTGIGGGILALHGSLKTSGQTQITSNTVDCHSWSCAGRGGGVAVSLSATAIMTNGTSIDYNQCGTNATVDVMLYGSGCGIYGNSGYIEISSNSSISHSNAIVKGRGGGTYMADDCRAQISDSIISMNNADQGGGMWFQDNVVANVTSCYILANNATISGAIGMQGSAAINIANTIMENNTAVQFSAIDAHLDLSGHLNYIGGMIVGGIISQCLILGTSDFQTTWNCNQDGSIYKRTMSEDFFSFDFFGCDAGSYWLGKASSNPSSLLSQTICHACPVGASCTGSTNSSSGLLALNGYWGYDVGNGIAKFSPCPDGYCCQDDQCSPYNYCHGNRQGMLCGSCIPGYSIQFFSESCAPNHQCHHASWFIPVLFIILVVIVVLLVLYDSFSSDGMIASLVFFYQASPLVISVNTKNILAPVIRILRSIFSLTPHSDGNDAAGLCLFPNMSRSTKFGLEIACYALFLIACIFVWMIHIIMKKVSWNKKIALWMDQHPPNTAVYLAAMTKIFFFGYITITINTMSMLQCDYFGDGRQRWFFDGDVECWTSWQKIAIAMSIILFFVPLVVTGIVTKWGHGFGIGKIQQMIRQVLVSPYKTRRWWWAGMLMGKRLLISIAYALTWTNGWRSASMLILCLIFLAVQLRIRPHANTEVVIVDAMSMLLICLMAALSVQRISSERFRIVDDEGSRTAVEIFQLLMFLTPGLTVGSIYLKRALIWISKNYKRGKSKVQEDIEIEMSSVRTYERME